MKWAPMMEKMVRRSGKLLGVRGIFILWALFTLLLLSAAFSKWGG